MKRPTCRDRRSSGEVGGAPWCANTAQFTASASASRCACTGMHSRIAFESTIKTAAAESPWFKQLPAQHTGAAVIRAKAPLVHLQES
eukprot:1144365-Pelagomonas_calceolata.AAC.2